MRVHHELDTRLAFYIRITKLFLDYDFQLYREKVRWERKRTLKPIWNKDEDHVDFLRFTCRRRGHLCGQVKV